MNYKIKNSSNSLTCTLQYDHKLRFVSSIPCKYDAETVGYAAARYIRHCPEVRDQLIPQAIKAALDLSKRTKPARVRIHTTAKRLSLPGETVYINVLVTPGTIAIKSVQIEPVSSTRQR